MRPWARWVGLGLGRGAVMLVLTFLFGEVAVRWFTDFRDTAPSIFAPSAIIPWELKPNVRIVQRGYWRDFRVTITTNALGYRDDAFALEKPPGTFRLLALGDSFTFGAGVENKEAYPAVLERLLNVPRPGAEPQRYEVINAGYASGYAPDTALVYFRHKGVVLHPDVVMLGYFGGNDLTDLMYTEWPEVDREGLPLRVTTPVTYVDRLGRLRTASWLGMGGGSMGRHALARRVKMVARDHSQFLNFLVQQYRLWMIGRGRVLDLDRFPSSGEERVRAAEAKLHQTLTGLQRLVEAQGSTFIVVSIPAKEELGASEPSQSETLIGTWAAQHHAPFINLDQLMVSQTPADLYFRVDPHWNARGHAYAAAAMDQFLRTPAQRAGLK